MQIPFRWTKDEEPDFEELFKLQWGTRKRNTALKDALRIAGFVIRSIQFHDHKKDIKLIEVLTMVKVQIDLDKKADKKIKRFMVDNNIANKKKAILAFINRYGGK